MGLSGRTLKNTAELVEEFDNVLQDDEMLVSYDVKSLFTSIPVRESIDICERRLRDDDNLLIGRVWMRRLSSPSSSSV